MRKLEDTQSYKLSFKGEKRIHRTRCSSQAVAHLRPHPSHQQETVLTAGRRRGITRLS